MSRLLPCPFCGAVTLSISLSEDEQREAAAGHWNRRAKTEHQKEETNAQ